MFEKALRENRKKLRKLVKDSRKYKLKPTPYNVTITLNIGEMYDEPEEGYAFSNKKHAKKFYHEANKVFLMLWKVYNDED